MAGLLDSGNYDAFAQPIVTTWSTSTTLNTYVVGTSAGLDTIALTVSAGANITGGVISFYVFDGAAYIPIKCPSVSNYLTYSSYPLVANVTAGFTVPVAGYPAFQFQLTSAITTSSGPGTTLITTISSSAPDVSVTAVGIDPSSTSQPVGSGSINTGQATVGASATLIVASRIGNGGNGAGGAGTGRTAVTISNNGTAVIFIGPAGVTTATGMAIYQNTSVTLNTTAAIYGVVASSTQPATYLETF